MNRRTFLAELLGTFTLAFVVRLSLIHTLPVPITPLLAALTLGLFVYTIGPISGCKINPAVTIGLLSVKKMKLSQAAFEIAAQLLGGSVAFLLASLLTGETVAVSTTTTPQMIAIGEALGTFFLAFGVASVVYGKVSDAASGLVIGGSLLLGILVAAPFSAGILNPAVALALRPDQIALYALAPLFGSIAGFWMYKVIVGAKK